MNKYLRLLRYDLPMHFILLLTNWLPDNIIFLRLRGALIRPFFGSCGKNLTIGRNVTFYNCKNIYIGSNVYIALDNWFNASTSIIVEDEVLFGPKSVITTSNHTKYNGSFRYGKPISQSVKIGKGTWISANCTITAGSQIEPGCLIASNSVVRNRVSKNRMYGGVPGKIIKPI